MNKVNLELRNYYKQIKKNLPFSKQSSILLKNLKNSIDDYISLHSHFNIQEIIDTFGTPDEIAMSFIASIDSKELKKQLSAKRIIFIGFLSLVILFTSVYLIAYIRGKNIVVYESEEEITIETITTIIGD